MIYQREKYARDKIERINRVLEISSKIIEEKGYDKLSINLIHRLTKIPIGTFYKDFPQGKEDILIQLLSKFKDEIEIEEKLNDEKIYEFIFRALDLGRRKKKLLIAVQIESLKDPDRFLLRANEYALDENFDYFKMIIDYIVGKSVDIKTLYTILAVWKAIVRQHITFRNLYGSDEEFANMIIKIVKALGK